MGKNIYLPMSIREDTGRKSKGVMAAYSMVLCCDSLTVEGLSEKSVVQRNTRVQPALEVLRRGVLLLIN